MSEVKCPMDYPDHDCNKCPGQFGKENLCDWPYIMGICPKINECDKIKEEAPLFPIYDAMYAEIQKETCRKCTEKIKLYPLTR